MRDFFILVAHLLSTIAKLLGPGGARAIIADSLLMKQQLLIINRHRKRAPRLTPLDRFLLGLWSLFLSHRRIQQAALIIRPSTLLRFHQWLKQRKYRLLYASARKTNIKRSINSYRHLSAVFSIINLLNSISIPGNHTAKVLFKTPMAA